MLCYHFNISQLRTYSRLANFNTSNNLSELAITNITRGNDWSKLVPDIVKILKENQTLKHVRLGYFKVHVDKKSLKAIVTALQGNETLQTLKLFHDYTEDEEEEDVDSIMKNIKDVDNSLIK